MTWGGVDTWAGNWIDGYNAYVTQTSEWNNADDTTDTRIRFDMYYTGDEKFGGLVGFTAPADGVFGINALFRKVWGGNPDIVVMKSDGTVIETFAAGGYGKETAIAIDGIELNKGEQILLVMQKGANTSGKNVGFISFDVDAIYDECPHTYGDDSTCDYCGEACKHSYGDDSICDDCGEACTHSYGNDNVCDNCGHDRTIEVETEDVENAINNILNGGTADITVVGPTTTMNEAFVVEKIENTVGYQYVLFNIDFDANGKLFLRHHFIVTGELPEVTVDSVAETLKQDEGYNTYYVDTYYEAGEYDVAKTIKVNGDTYKVSLYSYIKLALENDVEGLDAAEETLLKALYDLNEAMRNN